MEEDLLSIDHLGQLWLGSQRIGILSCATSMEALLREHLNKQADLCPQGIEHELDQRTEHAKALEATNDAAEKRTQAALDLLEKIEDAMDKGQSFQKVRALVDARRQLSV